MYFDYDETRIYDLARQTADAGIRLLVFDDGWFGEIFPPVNGRSGLGDWIPNSPRLPSGSGRFIEKVTDLPVANSPDKLLFGLWVEPEMVNPHSQLDQEHPEWVLGASQYARTLVRSQLVLDLSLREVQDFVMEAVSRILTSGRIQLRQVGQQSLSPRTSRTLSGSSMFFRTLSRVGTPDITCGKLMLLEVPDSTLGSCPTSRSTGLPTTLMRMTGFTFNSECP